MIKIAYVTEAQVRYELGLDDYHPSTAVITEFITKSDNEVDSILLDDASRFAEKILYLGDGRFIPLTHTASEIQKLYINGVEFREYEKDDMLYDGDVEYTSDTTPDRWTSDAASGDTLTWATDYSYNMYHSLKIAKGGSSASSWYSDEVQDVHDEQEYEASARIKVDSNSSGAVYLRLVYYDADGSVVVTHTSAAVSIEVTQPSSASALAIASSLAADTTQKLIVEGIVDSLEDYEVVTLTGTTSVSTSKSFSYIKGMRLDKAATGTVTATSNSAVVTNATLTTGQLEKNDWQEVKIAGPAPSSVQYAKVFLRCTSSTGNCWGDAFRLYARNWRFHPVDKRIEFFPSNIQDESNIKIVYLRTQDSELVSNLAAVIAALRCMVWVSGADTDADYQNLKLGGYAPLVLKRRWEILNEKRDFLIQQIMKYGFANADLGHGKFKKI